MIVVVPVTVRSGSLSSPRLVAQSALSDGDRDRLYEAGIVDVVRAVDACGGDLLVNYRDDRVAADDEPGSGLPSVVGNVVEEAIGDTDAARYEPQVGSTRSARIGNTVTHLLEREGATSVGVLDPLAPLVERTQIDAAAMALRRHDVVLGPGSGDSIYLSGFSTPIDFTDAYEQRPLTRLARRSEDGGLKTGFVPSVPTLDASAGLSATRAWITAREAADRTVPEATSAVLAGLDVSSEG